MKLLTNLIFEPKGKHDPALAYTIKDTVMSADGSKVYFAVQDVPANTPLTDEDYWKLQIDLSGSKHALDEAAAAFADQVKFVGTRVKGETAKATGNPVSFLPDAGSLLQPVTVLEPQQSGSGDPYPAGGGRNLFNSKWLLDAEGWSESNGVYAGEAAKLYSVYGENTAGFPISFTPNTKYTLSFIGSAAAGSNSRFIIFYSDGTATSLFIKDADNSEHSIVIDAGKSVIKLAFRYGYYGLVKLKEMQLEIGSTATTYAPYSNIRPFIGYDKLDLNHAGKNLLPNTTTTQTINGVTFTVNDDGSVAVNGTATATAIVYLHENISSGSYILSGGASDAVFVDIISNSAQIAKSAGGDDSFIIADGATGVARIVVLSGTTINATMYPMIRLASDPDATFRPYVCTLHTVQIGQTVYGGRFDWLTGKLAAEWAAVAFVGAESWARNAPSDTGNYLYYLRYANTMTNADINVAPVCSHVLGKALADLRYQVGASMNDSGMITLNFMRPETGTLDGFKAYLAAQHAAGTPVQFVWKLATPIEIQLTPHIISAADPEQTNTLYGDGSIEVEYVKPLHVSIEERVAAALAAATE